MSRSTDFVEYYVVRIQCDLCRKKANVKDGKAPNGWTETNALYKLRPAPPNTPMVMATGWPGPVAGESFPVAFCCKEHEDLWFKEYDKSDVASPYITFTFGGQ